MSLRGDMPRHHGSLQYLKQIMVPMEYDWGIWGVDDVAVLSYQLLLILFWTTQVIKGAKYCNGLAYCASIDDAYETNLVQPRAGSN